MEVELEVNEVINTVNEYSTNDLESIQKKIEKLQKIHQIEILRILHNYSIKNKISNNDLLNENNYGVFVNLTEIPSNIIKELENYIKYVDTQENHLDLIENQKEKYKTKYFAK
jgi:hypothetical protein